MSAALLNLPSPPPPRTPAPERPQGDWGAGGGWPDPQEGAGEEGRAAGHETPRTVRTEPRHPRGRPSLGTFTGAAASSLRRWWGD